MVVISRDVHDISQYRSQETDKKADLSKPGVQKILKYAETDF